MNLAVIPAKCESKRIPHKNVRELGGMPLVEWTIRAAMEAESIDRIIISTDCDEVREIAGLYKLECVAQRKEPDDAATKVIHVLGELDEEPDLVVMLQPTSPFRTAKHIEDMVHPRARYEASFKRVHGTYHDAYYGINRADFIDVTNGAIYVAMPDLLRTYPGDMCLTYEMDKIPSHEIDSEFDWQVAEMIVEKELYHA